MKHWRKPCEHGHFQAHNNGYVSGEGAWITTGFCPGGSPITAADLEGEKVWWCEVHDNGIPGQLRLAGDPINALCLKGIYYGELTCRMVERLLIPIPDQQPATEGT